MTIRFPKIRGAGSPLRRPKIRVSPTIRKFPVELNPPTPVVPPPPFDIVFTPSFAGGTITVGTTSIPVRGDGSSTSWIPLIAYDETTGEPVWVSGIEFNGFSGTGGPTSSCRTDIDGDGNIYIFFSVGPNTLSGAITVVTSDPSGSLGPSAQTFNNGANTVREPFIAKFDQDGNPLFCKRLINTQSGTETGLEARTNAQVIDARGQYIFLVASWTGGGSGSGNISYVIAPGDPNSYIYTREENHINSIIMRLDKTNGELVDSRVIGHLNSSSGNGNLTSPSSFIGGGISYNETSDLYAVPLFNSTFTGDQGFYDTEGLQTQLRAVGSSFRKGVAISFDSSLNLNLNEAMAGQANGSSTALRRATPMSDGGVVAAGTIFGPGTATFTDSGGTGTENPTIAIDDQPFIVRYDNSDNILWVKLLEPSPSGNDRILDIIEDVDNDALFVSLRVRLSQQVTFGPGESGEVTYNFVSSGNEHIALFRLNRTSGDLEWVQPIRTISYTTGSYSSLIWDNPETGNIDLFFSLSAQLEIDPLNTPQTITCGSGTDQGINRISYTKDGAFVSRTEFWNLPNVGGPGLNGVTIPI